MWIDDDGVAHTVALPEPAIVMADEFRTSLDAIAASELATLRDIVERAEARVYEQNLTDLVGSEMHVEAVPQDGLLRGRVVTAEDVGAAIGQVELRWRLDAIVALDDYLD